MDKNTLEGTYIIRGVDYMLTPRLSASQQSRVIIKLDENEELDYYGRLGSLLLSINPYENQQGIIPSQPIDLEISDYKLREEIEARAFSLDKASDTFRELSFSPKTLEERLKGTLVNIAVNERGDITPNLTYLKEE